MFTKLKELLQRVINRNMQQSNLEAFINSKNPLNAAEVEHWVNTYMQQSKGGRYGF
jgi:hypothetical protein